MNCNKVFEKLEKIAVFLRIKKGRKLFHSTKNLNAIFLKILRKHFHMKSPGQI